MIKKLHERLIDNIIFGPEEGQGNNDNLSCSNERNSVIPCPSFGVESLIITPKEINIFTNFAISLKRIHTRLLMEGYIVENGKIYKLKR